MNRISQESTAVQAEKAKSDDLIVEAVDVEKSFGDMKVLKGAWAKNLEVRPPEDRDWEHMQGRAVSKKNKK